MLGPEIKDPNANEIICQKTDFGMILGLCPANDVRQ